jgi:hypothetical protein
MAKGRVKPHAKNLASLFRGLYSRVASRLNVDPSYVSRVARGERESQEIVQALEFEMTQIVKVLEFNHSSSRRVTKRKGAGRRRIKKTERAA